MAKLIFKAADVRRVVEHALEAEKHMPRVTGYTDDLKAITEPGKPAVLLVHDEGVYLMSNGEPRDIIEGESSFVAYAKGCNPKTDEDWWERSRELVGGDDFGETLPWAEQMKEVLDRGARTISVVLRGNSISFTA